ncbi:glutathione S-transferase family protein [Pseudoxanthobacter sp.]|uniref:glutathione S-transferase family protein n=1 Tax=Pseudoxanthobacter sp. TaxID=1925742 RepID=UPI002FE3F765
MILIGQYDSPFVRRVGVALRLYGIAFEHKPWSTFSDAEAIARFNPLRRVPTLVLDDGEVLIESSAILDHLDDSVGRDQALIARHGLERRQALKIAALSTGLADKAVALVYERALHEATSPLWIARCQTQVGDVLAALEAIRAARPGPFLFGPRLNHADVALACALRFLKEAHPALFDAARLPALAAHSARCEAMEVFQTVSQVFIPPA